MRPDYRYADRKAHGLCSACGVNNAQDGYVRCRDCRERHRLSRTKKSGRFAQRTLAKSVPADKLMGNLI